MPVDRTLTLTLFQRKRDLLGGAAGSPRNGELAGSCGRSAVPARSGERIKVRAIPAAHLRISCDNSPCVGEITSLPFQKIVFNEGVSWLTFAHGFIADIAS